MSLSFFDQQQVSVLDEDEQFTIRYRWFTPTAVTTVVIPGVLTGLPCLVAVLGVEPIRGFSGWGAATLIVTIWMAALYCYLAKLCNSTSIIISPTTVSVRHAPLPWRAGPTLERSRIEGIVPRQRLESQMENGAELVTGTFEVVAVLAGTEVVVLSRLYDFDIAAEISRYASEHLGLIGVRKDGA